MRSILAETKKTGIGHASQLIAGIARKLLFNQLAGIKEGCLTIEENGEIKTFGNKAHNSQLIAHISVKDIAAYPQVLFGGATGAGEAYMQGSWTSSDLVMVVRVIVANQRTLDNLDFGWNWFNRLLDSLSGYLKLNTKNGSKKNISAHYDLSNDFFKLFLDKSMMYSAALFPDKSLSLEEASFIKLDHICRRLNLKPSDHLLEIGTGWGGMAIHAAKYYGCKVTTTTISQEQYSLAKTRVEEEGLEDKIYVLKEDYRDLEGQYDKIVSIEMIEAVGHQYYNEYFSRCSNLLKDNGLMLIQAITTQDQRYEREKDKVDFIRRYIFPGGCLPSNEILLRTLAKVTDMHLVCLDDMTLDYAQTLSHWKRRFFNKIDEVKRLGFDDVFIRMWDFYLSYCEGGFSERVIGTSQFLFAKPKCRELPKVGEDRH
ncbi:SAM-dependent methyltransferase [Agarilytica rhodophyticola]|uniref:SAM-dependent methyltransferase n=1 Tax=Agarilytica rhodophyticola TaxID=1737490 RepID=UPI000B344830|nr:cyclopropane-fatty-acyl-phospholipid synthase family protein [Agarilytica rhodophyticola]